jgi:hypothetical protein
VPGLRREFWARYLRIRSVREGFLGGRRLWQLIGLAMFSRQIVRRLMGSSPRVLASQRLEPGETLILRVARRADKRR